MISYSFTIILHDCDDVNEETANTLYEAGCDDALFGISNGVVTLDFNREDESLLKILLSAVRDVRSAGFRKITIQI